MAVFLKGNSSGSRRRRPARRLAALLLSGLLLPACGLFSPDFPEPPRNGTRTIRFKCDGRINSGMLLPVEIIYLGPDDDVKALTGIGPDAWFDSEKRNKWPHKKTLMFRNGQDRRIRLDKPPETETVVVFASLYGVRTPEAQQVVLGPEADKEEIIWVGSAALYH